MAINTPYRRASFLSQIFLVNETCSSVPHRLAIFFFDKARILKPGVLASQLVEPVKNCSSVRVAKKTSSCVHKGASPAREEGKKNLSNKTWQRKLVKKNLLACTGLTRSAHELRLLFYWLEFVQWLFRCLFYLHVQQLHLPVCTSDCIRDFTWDRNCFYLIFELLWIVEFNTIIDPRSNDTDKCALTADPEVTSALYSKRANTCIELSEPILNRFEHLLLMTLYKVFIINSWHNVTIL